MLISSEYNQAIKYAKGLEEGIFTSLTARLGFKEEVAPKDVESVKYRLKWETIGPLKNYLKEKENFSLEDFHSKNPYFKRLTDNAKFELKANLRKLSLEIKITSQNDVPRKDMLNLDALNNFILTGK